MENRLLEEKFVCLLLKYWSRGERSFVSGYSLISGDVGVGGMELRCDESLLVGWNERELRKGRSRSLGELSFPLTHEYLTN